MKYVLDASIALKCVLLEAGTDKALALQQDFQNGIHELIAPDTLYVEVAHALTRASRRRIIPPSDVEPKFADVLAATPRIYPHIPLLSRAIELSTQFSIGVYDCLYVALAEWESCELVTADQKLVNALHPTHAFVIHLSSL